MRHVYTDILTHHLAPYSNQGCQMMKSVIPVNSIKITYEFTNLLIKNKRLGNTHLWLSVCALTKSLNFCLSIYIAAALFPPMNSFFGTVHGRNISRLPYPNTPPYHTPSYLHLLRSSPNIFPNFPLQGCNVLLHSSISVLFIFFTNHSSCILSNPNHFGVFLFTNPVKPHPLSFSSLISHIYTLYHYLQKYAVP